MTINYNNDIMESDIELKGLYILSAPLLDEKNVVKFGVTGCLQNRISAYTSYFKNPYYLACYKLVDEYPRNGLFDIETEILNITCQYNSDEFSSEYRRIKFDILHDIICNYLDKNKIEYEMFIKPIWKHFNKPKQGCFIAVKHECPTCKYDFKKKSNLKTHLNKKNKCKPQNNIQPNTTIVQPNSSIITKNESMCNNYNCNYCNKSFSRKDVASKHMKLNCDVFKQQTKQLEYGNKLLKDKNKQLEYENKLLEIKIKNKELESELKKLKKEIKKGTK